MSEPFELPPPDEETMGLLQNMQRSPGLRPADPRYVRFYHRSKINKLKSYGGKVVDANGAETIIKGEGRPIYEPVEYMEILTPGDKDTVVDRPVRKVDRYAWADRYKAFRNGTQTQEGQPLSTWAGVSPERVEEYAAMKIRTVEALAAVSDVNLPNLGPGARADRDKASAYLAVMKGGAPVAELKAENEDLRRRLEALEAVAKAGTVIKESEAKKPEAGKEQRR